MTTINSIHDPAPNTQELVGLTGLRGVAALMVLAFHLFAFAEPREIALNIAGDRYELHWLITGGFMGVHIFFVLSGFLLTLPFARHALGQRAGVNLSRYVSRRLWRVFPAYWTQLIILVVAAYLMTQRIPSFETLLAHIAMFPIAWKLEYADAINNVYWTLPTELSFYFLLPIIVFVVGRMAATGLRKWIIAGGVLLLAAIIYRYLAFQMVHDSPIPERVWLIGQLPGYIDLFAYGMLAAFAVIKLEGQPTRFYAR
ncbi:MAG TPA: acyltransferase, partial [Methylobacter sp.]